MNASKTIRALLGFGYYLLLSMLIGNSVAEDRASMTYRELLDELAIIAETFESSEVLKTEFSQLQASHGINNSQKNYRDFIRVRLAFEATRDSGLWQLRWTVTDKEPNSDAIWHQWATLSNPQYIDESLAEATAIAECDELSALFAMIAGGLGVKRVGLFWPTSNHTVAVWTSQDPDGNPVRIVIPTSQVFISHNAGLGTTEFDPSQQKTIYDYGRRDITLDHTIPVALARMMIDQVREFGDKPATELQARRNRLSAKWGGS